MTIFFMAQVEYYVVFYMIQDLNWSTVKPNMSIITEQYDTE